MTELDVEPRRKLAASELDEPRSYLVLGDFGGPDGEPSAVNRETLNAALERMEVTVEGARLRELKDFHPDRLYRHTETFRDLREENLDSRCDSIRAERMRALLGDPGFRTLESAWRGLDFAVRRMNDRAHRLYMAQLSQPELTEDLTEAPDLRATRLYELLHARPWRAVFGLYSFCAAEVELLSRVTLLAAHAKTSFVAQGSEDMGEGWGELRSIPEAASLGLALPRFLLRLPYGARTVEIESFPFEELEAKPDPSGYLWGNPALACLTVLTRALYEAEEEEEDAFDLCGLPLHTYEWDGQQMCTPCAEIILTEEQAAALIARGLMPLMCSPDAGRVRLAGLRAAGGQPLLL